MSNNSNIEEIPLDAEAPEVEVREDNSEPVEENIPETAQPVEENNQAKRGRGRPKGSLNKPNPPPKPKPKPPAPKTKVKKKPPTPEYESESSEDDQPVSRPQYDSRQIASEVLGLLQQQRHNSTAARRNHYASWFQNM